MGKGEKTEHLKNLCKELEIDDRIHFLGYRHDVNRILSVCNLGTSASLREGLGLNLIEEMASGLPIVASQNRGHVDIVTEESGVLLQENTVEDFAKAFRDFYKSPDEYLSTRANVLTSTEDVSRLAEIYDQALAYYEGGYNASTTAEQAPEAMCLNAM